MADRSSPEIAADCPESIFSSSEICYETEDADFIRYYDRGRSSGIGFGPVMEILVENNKSNQVYGHYLRYYGLRRRPRPILRKLRSHFSGLVLWFSDDFQEAAIISSDDKIFLRLQRRALNFYATHLSLLSSDNARTHDGFIAEVRRDFREMPYQEVLKMRPDGKTRRAIQTLFTVQADLGA